MSEQQVVVPDIGDFDKVNVIDVLVSEGDVVNKEDALITLESDKASMDVPSPYSGRVKKIIVKAGDQVSEGSRILVLDVPEKPVRTNGERDPREGRETQQPAEPAPSPQPVSPAPVRPVAGAAETAPSAPRERIPAQMSIDERAFSVAHASPSVRRFARELGADLGQIQGSGPKGRILKEDVQRFVKARLEQTRAGLGSVFPAMPAVDFSRFGEITTEPLTRIQKHSATHLHRSWVSIPHVTQFDEADITALEAFRKEHRPALEREGVRLTLLPFLMKACAAALVKFPRFNAALDPEGNQLIIKKYVHIGIAVDTPDGLLVPVVRDVDRKGICTLARELAELSTKAREHRLSPQELQGACFSISNLGGIGGTAFTPIINAPEVAILGVSRSAYKPVYQDGSFVPRLMLPLSLSYDHRVIDGALAARFSSYLCEVIADLRKVLL